MPNWCYNTVELTHEDPKMIARARAAFLDKGLLNEFVPEENLIAFLPEEIQNA